MTGVYIKGMEMPDHCLRCLLKGIDDECVLQGVEVCDEYDWKQQMANCPLVPVPPHGRLIDADALLKKIRCRSLDEHGEYLLWYVDEDDIKNAPTVIPASEEGE